MKVIAIVLAAAIIGMLVYTIIGLFLVGNDLNNDKAR